MVSDRVTHPFFCDLVQMVDDLVQTAVFVSVDRVPETCVKAKQDDSKLGAETHQ